MKSAGHHSLNSFELAGNPRSAHDETPASIHTSTMSSSLRAVPRHFLRLTSMSSTPFRCNSNSLGAFVASFRSSAFDPTTVLVPHFSHVQIGSGTPQYLCRLMTQWRGPIRQWGKRLGG